MTRWPLALLVGISLFMALPALATFHLVKVVEVFPGTAALPTAQYVMLQMYFSGQNRVSGHSLKVFDGAGASVGTFTFSDNVANGANLATLLIATSDAASLFAVKSDLSMAPAIQPGGGAVCWDVVDCVAWGDFSAPSALPKSPGTPFNAPDGLQLDMAMHRTLSSGGAVTDFVFAPPAPRNNAGEGGTGPTPGATATPTPLPTPRPCVGDCSGTHSVAVSDLITLVDIALGTAQPSTCPSVPAGATVDISLIITAVNNALNGCP